jgi:two-component system CheB/CheR fusion protein
LKSTNEELQSTNEELQSTNEELETSKEEMQSLNEELTTVNAELASNLEQVSLTAKCREVLRTLVFLEEEVRSTDGTWYLMRIMPYRTSENLIDGVVITFVAIDRLQQSEQSVVAQSYFEAIVNTVREPLIVLNDELQVVSCNRRFYQVFDANASQTEGASLFDLAGVQWDVSELRLLLEEILPEKKAVDNFRLSASISHVGHRSFILNARRLTQPPGLADMILLAFDEIEDTV